MTGISFNLPFSIYSCFRVFKLLCELKNNYFLQQKSHVNATLSIANKTVKFV